MCLAAAFAFKVLDVRSTSLPGACSLSERTLSGGQCLERHEAKVLQRHSALLRTRELLSSTSHELDSHRFHAAFTKAWRSRVREAEEPDLNGQACAEAELVAAEEQKSLMFCAIISAYNEAGGIQHPGKVIGSPSVRSTGRSRAAKPKIWLLRSPCGTACWRQEMRERASWPAFEAISARPRLKAGLR